MYRPLSTINLPAAALVKLQENGFHYLEDVVTHKGMGREASNLLRQWNLHETSTWTTLTTSPHSLTALDLLEKECTTPHIVTWGKEMDDMLGGGIPLGIITELCGAPGSAKTQLSLQLCICVQIPEVLGGVGGEAVFIDTASGFTVQRLREMAEACVEHCQSLVSSNSIEFRECVESLQTDKLLAGVHFVAVHGIAQLLAAVRLLPQLCCRSSKIRLVVIDNLAFSFQCGDPCTTIDRTSYLYRILGDLQNLAAQFNLAVLITNQLTTRVGTMTKSGKSELVPALGESFGHRINQRIVLGRIRGDKLAAVMLKGRTEKRTSKSANFRITKQGIRD